jgi:hypothetical protein
MSGDDGCAQWRELEDEARDQAAEHSLSAEGRPRVAEAIALARQILVGDDVRSHSVCFDPAKWQLDGDPVPDRLMSAGKICRSDLFDLASREPAVAAWPLFCCTYIWGQGRNGYGRARFDKIIRTTPRESIITAVQEAVARQGSCGSLSAYNYLRGERQRRRVPHWGPAFFTKLLYFSDSSQPRRALILDQVLAREVAGLTRMPHLVDSRGRARRWTEYRYGVYLAWMAQTAAEFQVPADLLEYALFRPWER